MITEAEAYTKWCPFSQIAIGPDGEVQANTLSGRSCNCAGSACMAWRGQETKHFANQAEALFRRTGERRKATPADMEGYCGLAGAPGHAH